MKTDPIKTIDQLTSRDLELEVRVRSWGGTNIARCNGLTASCTIREEDAAMAVAAKAIKRIAKLQNDPAIALRTPVARHIGGNVWTVTYHP